MSPQTARLRFAVPDSTVSAQRPGGISPTTTQRERDAYRVAVENPELVALIRRDCNLAVEKHNGAANEEERAEVRIALGAAVPGGGGRIQWKAGISRETGEVSYIGHAPKVTYVLDGDETQIIVL